MSRCGWRHGASLAPRCRRSLRDRSLGGSGLRQPVFDEAELLSGAALALAPLAYPFRVPTRRRSVRARCGDARVRRAVRRAFAIRGIELLTLIEALEERGMFSLDYAEVTRTASATFHERQGNCLSFTMLFVGLAREAGSHGDVSKRRGAADVGERRPSRHREPRECRRSHGLRRRDDRRLQHSRRARRPAQPPRQRRVRARLVLYESWRRSAAARRVRGKPRLFARGRARVSRDRRALGQSRACCTRATATSSTRRRRTCARSRSTTDEQSALANLVLVYEALGEPELAAEYRDRVQGYRERNPYYHYAVAARALRAAAVRRRRLTSLRKALRLKRDEHEFYTLRGQVLTALGRARDAQQSFERAREFEALEYARSRVARALRRVHGPCRLRRQSCGSRRRNFCTRWPVLTSVV